MDCPRCGEFNSMTAKRCASCGARMKPRRAERAPEPLVASTEAASPGEPFEPEPGRPPLASPWRVSAALAGLVAAGLANLGEAISALAFAAASQGPAPVPTASTPFPPFTPWVSIVVTLGAGIAFLRWIVPFQRDLLALSGDRRVLMSPYLSFLVPVYSIVAPLRLMRRLRTALDATLAALPPPRGEAIDYRSHERLLERPPATPAVERWFAAWTAMWVVPWLANAFGGAKLGPAMGGMIGATAAVLAVGMVLAFDDGLREAERRARALSDEEEPVFPSFSDNGLVHGAQTGTIAGLHAVLVVGAGASALEVNPWALLVGGGVWLVARRVRPGVRVQVALATAVVALVAGGFSAASDRRAKVSAVGQMRAAVEKLEQLAESADGTASQLDTSNALLAEVRRLAPHARTSERAVWLCRGERAAQLRKVAGAWLDALRGAGDQGALRLDAPLEPGALERRRAAVAEARRAVQQHQRFVADIPRWTEDCLVRGAIPYGDAADVRRALEEDTRQHPAEGEELKRRARELDEMSAALAILAREAGRYTVADGAPVFADPAVQSEWDATIDRLDALDGD